MGKQADEFRAGAVASLAVLRELENILQPHDSAQTTQEYFERRDAALASLVAAAGPLPERARGVLETLAEYLANWIQDGAEYNLEIWRPEATMTPEEVAAARRTLYEHEAAGLYEHLEARSNVVPFRR